jgi:hypothetical protein
MYNATHIHLSTLHADLRSVPTDKIGLQSLDKLLPVLCSNTLQYNKRKRTLAYRRTHIGMLKQLVDVLAADAAYTRCFMQDVDNADLQADTGADADAAQALLQAQTDADAYTHADALQADVKDLHSSMQCYVPSSVVGLAPADLQAVLYALAQDADLLRQAVQIVLQVRNTDAGTL